MTNDRDPGLQQERTTLAWSRTSLALAAGALVVGRLTLGDLGPGALLPAAVSGVLALWVWLGVQRRKRLALTHPQDPRFSILRDGRLPAAAAGVVGLLALGEVAAALIVLR